MPSFDVVIQYSLPRFLVFLGSCIFFAIVDLGWVFEPDAMEYVAGNVFSAVRKTKWKVVGEFEFHLCILPFEKLLECQAFNTVSHSSHDWSR